MLNHRLRTLVMRVFTGGGKTTITLLEMDEDYRIIYAAPKHENIKENITDSQFRIYDFLQLESRARVCTNPEAKMMFKQNYDLQSMCKGCKDRNVCKYEKNMRRAYKDRPNLAITHGHLNTWLPNFLNREIDGEIIGDDYDVLIIDENPIKTFMTTFMVKKVDLFTIESIARQAKCDDDLMYFLELILQKPIDYDKLEAVVLNEKKKSSNIKRFSKKAYNLYKDGIITKIPPNILNHIYKISSYVSTKDIKKMVVGLPYSVKLSYFNPETIGKLNIKKIIGLDGTASEEVWQKMLGVKPNIMKAWNNYSHAYQLKEWRYPISSWIRYKKTKFPNTVPTKLCSIIDKIAEKKKRNVLVVCTKKIKKVIEKLTTSKNIEYAHYYALRGINNYYKTCDTVILAHEPNPPQTEMETYVELSGWDSKIWRKVFREEEMQQAIGRVRENLDEYIKGKKRETREVYILPNTGVSGFESKLLADAEVLTRNELLRKLDSKGSFTAFRSANTIILDSLPCTITKLVKLTGASKGKLNKHLLYLEKKGLIRKTGRGKYETTTKGKTTRGKSTFRFEAKY